MTTPSPVKHPKPFWPILIAMICAALLVTAALLAVLGTSSSEAAKSVAKGVLIGAPVGLALALVAVLTQRRHYDPSTPMGRRASLLGDERQQRIVTGAFAVTGLASLLYASGAVIALALGVEAFVALALLIFALIGTLLVASWVFAARS